MCVGGDKKPAKILLRDWLATRWSEIPAPSLAAGGVSAWRCMREEACFVAVAANWIVFSRKKSD